MQSTRSAPALRGSEADQVTTDETPRKRPRVFHPTGGESRVKQGDGVTDINTIVRRYIETGTTDGNAKPPTYGDFSEIGDFHSALNRVKAAETDFMKLDSALRSACGNDPGAFLDKCASEDGRAFLAEHGLLAEKAPEPFQGDVAAAIAAALAPEGAKTNLPEPPPALPTPPEGG